MRSSGHRSRFLLAGLLAGAALSVQAVEFDEKLKAPAVSAPTFKSQAQSFRTKLEALGQAAPYELITSQALTAERFDLTWKLQRAVDSGAASAELEELGFSGREDGSFAIDYNAHPEWHRLDDALAGWLPLVHWSALSADLKARGFRESDVEAMKSYVESNDLRRMVARGTVPISLSFSKVVKKLDRLKRPVPDALVMSYLYQRSRVTAEATRQWAHGLLQTLDAQRARILLSYLGEMEYHGLITPDDGKAGIADVLRTVRLPNYEQLAQAELNGVTP